MSPGAQTTTYYGHPRLEMHPFVPQGARTILDIGCGAGGFAAGLRKARSGLEIWGVEYEPAAAEQARKILDQVHVGDAIRIVPTLPREYFDCICLNDVLEHLLEPGNLLPELIPLLRPEGCIVASLPNVRYFWNIVDLVWHGRWEYTAEGICDRTHLRFFTRSSMLELFKRGGYSVETAQGINPTGSVAFKIFNALTLGRFAEMRYLQFALVAHPESGKPGRQQKADPLP